jgi:hypothetical protein
METWYVVQYNDNITADTVVEAGGTVLYETTTGADAFSWTVNYYANL